MAPSHTFKKYSKISCDLYCLYYIALNVIDLYQVNSLWFDALFYTPDDTFFNNYIMACTLGVVNSHVNYFIEEIHYLVDR